MKLKVTLISALLLITIETTIAQEKLYVFYPTTVRPQAIQDKMQNGFNGVSVTVFGRYNDFIAKIAVEPPDAVLTKTTLIMQLTDYSVALNGSRKGKTNDTYVVLSINTPLDVKSINATTVIGVIDLLGRNNMKTFVEQFFPTEPKLKRVTKIEDLLPLLTFNMAAGILIEDVFVDFFKSTSQLTFCVSPLPATKNGIVALGVKKGRTIDKTVAALKKTDMTINSIFEVDLWK